MLAKVEDLEYESRVGEYKVRRNNNDGGKKTAPPGASTELEHRHIHRASAGIPYKGQGIAEEPDDDEIQCYRIASE